MDSLWSRWFRRQRLHRKPARACARSCTCPFLGTLSESLVSWHSSSFGRLCCASPIYSRVARFKPVDTFQGGSPSCLVTLMVLDFGRVMNRSDLTFRTGPESAGVRVPMAPAGNFPCHEFCAGGHTGMAAGSCGRQLPRRPRPGGCPTLRCASAPWHSLSGRLCSSSTAEMRRRGHNTAQLLLWGDLWTSC